MSNVSLSTAVSNYGFKPLGLDDLEKMSPTERVTCLEGELAAIDKGLAEAKDNPGKYTEAEVKDMTATRSSYQDQLDKAKPPAPAPGTGTKNLFTMTQKPLVPGQTSFAYQLRANANNTAGTNLQSFKLGYGVQPQKLTPVNIPNTSLTNEQKVDDNISFRTTPGSIGQVSVTITDKQVAGTPVSANFTKTELQAFLDKNPERNPATADPMVSADGKTTIPYNMRGALTATLNDFDSRVKNIKFSKDVLTLKKTAETPAETPSTPTDPAKTPPDPVVSKRTATERTGGKAPWEANPLSNEERKEVASYVGTKALIPPTGNVSPEQLKGLKTFLGGLPYVKSDPKLAAQVANATDYKSLTPIVQMMEGKEGIKVDAGWFGNQCNLVMAAYDPANAAKKDHILDLAQRTKPGSEFLATPDPVVKRRTDTERTGGQTTVDQVRAAPGYTKLQGAAKTQVEAALKGTPDQAALTNMKTVLSAADFPATEPEQLKLLNPPALTAADIRTLPGYAKLQGDAKTQVEAKLNAAPPDQAALTNLKTVLAAADFPATAPEQLKLLNPPAPTGPVAEIRALPGYDKLRGEAKGFVEAKLSGTPDAQTLTNLKAILGAADFPTDPAEQMKRVNPQAEPAAPEKPAAWKSLVTDKIKANDKAMQLINAEPFVSQMDDSTRVTILQQLQGGDAAALDRVTAVLSNAGFAGADRHAQQVAVSLRGNQEFNQMPGWIQDKVTNQLLSSWSTPAKADALAKVLTTNAFTNADPASKQTLIEGANPAVADMLVAKGDAKLPGSASRIVPNRQEYRELVPEVRAQVYASLLGSNDDGVSAMVKTIETTNLKSIDPRIQALLVRGSGSANIDLDGVKFKASIGPDSLTPAQAAVLADANFPKFGPGVQAQIGISILKAGDDKGQLEAITKLMASLQASNFPSLSSVGQSKVGDQLVAATNSKEVAKVAEWVKTAALT